MDPFIPFGGSNLFGMPAGEIEATQERLIENVNCVGERNGNGGWCSILMETIGPSAGVVVLTLTASGLPESSDVGLSHWPIWKCWGLPLELATGAFIMQTL